MTEPRILALETSSPRGAVALAEGDRLLIEERFSAVEGHGRDLLPVVERLCRAQGWMPGTIQECHLSIGPGSFTGLRVAVAFTRHLALAVGARIVPVPTLDVLAANVLTMSDAPAAVAVMLDAKRAQVFGAIYRVHAETCEPLAPAVVVEPARLLADAPRPIAALGEGTRHHLELLRELGISVLPDAFHAPSAAVVHRLGRRLAANGGYTRPEALVPLYVRRPEAEELWEKRQASNP